MLVAIGLKAALLSAALLGLLVPLRSRMLRDRGEEAEPAVGYFANRPALGLITPLANFLDAAAAPASPGRWADSRVASIAPVLAVLAPMMAWAVIPFGSRYQVGDLRIDLVVANLETGVLWLIVAAFLSLCAGLLIDGSDENRVRAAVMGSSQMVGMGLSLVGVILVFGSLNPIEISAVQDRTRSLLPLITGAGFDLKWLDVPAWGVVYQPVAFGLYLVCGSLALRPVPLDSLRSAREAGASGAAIQLLRLSEHLDALLLAGETPVKDRAVFNLGHPVPRSLLQFVETLQQLAEFDTEMVPFPPEAQAIDIGDYYGDFARFHALTGWSPQVDLDQGLERTLDYYRALGGPHGPEA
jgi:hypothetical protein